MYKSASGPLWNYCYGTKHMHLKSKNYTTSKLVFQIRFKLKFYYSRPQTWKLHMKLPIGLVAYCSTHQAMQATNTRAKAETSIWVPNPVVLVLPSRFVHWNWSWKWCIVTRYRPGLVSYGHRPLSHYLVLLLGFRELRGVMTLLTKLIGLSCVTIT